VFIGESCTNDKCGRVWKSHLYGEVVFYAISGNSKFALWQDYDVFNALLHSSLENDENTLCIQAEGKEIGCYERDPSSSGMETTAVLTTNDSEESNSPIDSETMSTDAIDKANKSVGQLDGPSTIKILYNGQGK